MKKLKRIKVQRWQGGFLNWTEEQTALLGKISDYELTRKTGFSERVVSRERRHRGIPPFQEKPPVAEWTPEMIALLGKESDKKVAESLGLTKGVVLHKRWVLGIRSWNRRKSRPREWTEAEIALLGTQPDRIVAEAIGVWAITVARKRRGLGIAAYSPPTPSPEWPEEMLALLGTVEDTIIARRMGISSSTVQQKRSKLGIPPLRTHRRIVPNKELIRLLEFSDVEVRRRSDLSATAIQRLRKKLDIPAPNNKWTPEEVALLGTARDTVIARRIGREAHSVRQKRAKLGIAPFEDPRLVRSGLRRGKRGRFLWPEDLAALLGKISDSEVARKIGISVGAVGAERRRRGFPDRPKPTPPTAQILAFSDAEVQRRTGLGLRSIQRFRKELGIANPSAQPKNRWSPEVVARLGTVPDTVVAEELGITPTSVNSRRRALGIPSCPKNAPWTPEEDALLGTVPDRVVARRLDRALYAVKTRRDELDIAHFQPGVPRR